MTPAPWGTRTVRALWLAASRRVDGAESDAVALRYDAGMGALMATVMGLSVLEVGVVHLIVPWPAVRIALLVLGAWTVLVVAGFWAGLRTHPHLVTPDGLRLRYAHYLSLDLPWASVLDARRVSRYEPTSVTVRDGVLHLPVSGSTNLLVTLAAEQDLPLLFGRTRRGRQVACHADDPAAFLVAVRARRPSSL